MDHSPGLLTQEWVNVQLKFEKMKQAAGEAANKTNRKFWLLDDLVGISDHFVPLVVGNLASDRPPKISLALAQLACGLLDALHVLSFFLLVFWFVFV